MSGSILTLAWDEMQKRANEWQQATFPGGTVASKMAHLVEEAEEVVADPDDLYEWADMMLLYMGAASVAGHSMSTILRATNEKLEINKERKWGKPQPNGVVHHVKEGTDGPTD